MLPKDLRTVVVPASVCFPEAAESRLLVFPWAGVLAERRREFTKGALSPWNRVDPR